MADNDIHRIELRAKSVEALRAFLDGTDIDLGCRPVVRRQGDEYVVEVFAPIPTLDGLQRARNAAGVSVNVIENASEVGRARQAEVSSGNRFSARIAPSGLGIKE